MTASELSYSVHITEGIPTTNPDLPPDLTERYWSPTSNILISGPTEALLVDPSMTVTQSQRLVEWLAGRRPVSKVYVTHGHGDHWFGLGAVLRAHPAAHAYALPEVVEDMKAQSSAAALEATWYQWFPNQITDDFVLATPLVDDNTLTIDGAQIRPIRLGHTDCDNTTCLHIPDLRLVVAGDAIYNNVHLMLAASDADGRAEWLRALDTVEALSPEAVVAGHKDPANDDDPRHIEETRSYIRDFERGIAATSTALGLYEYMLERYPDRINRGALWGSSRAAKG